MLTRKPGARITTAMLTSSPSNLNAANNGFRVFNVTPNTPNTRPKFGKLTNATRKRYCAAAAVINYQSPNISGATRLVRNVAADSIPDARFTTIFILKLIKVNELFPFTVLFAFTDLVSVAV